MIPVVLFVLGLFRIFPLNLCFSCGSQVYYAVQGGSSFRTRVCGSNPCLFCHVRGGSNYSSLWTKTPISPLVLFFMLYKVVLTFTFVGETPALPIYIGIVSNLPFSALWFKAMGVTIQMKASF